MMRSLFLVTFFFSLHSYAQTKEGKVVYERTMQMPVRSFGNASEELQKQLPKSRTDHYELLFNSQHALYQYLPSAVDENAGTFTSGNVVLRFAGGSGDVSYTNFEKKTRLDQREMFEKTFLVLDSLGSEKWKLSEETKQVLNFTARKATTTRIMSRNRMSMENGEIKRETISDTLPVVVWYTTDVPVSAGPDFAGQLPGLILEIDMNNGQTVTKAIEFSPKIAAGKIKEPKGGKVFTPAEFAIEREKMLNEMRKNMPNGNVIRMN